jgi:membrane protease YdiL (CAAX protease family)
MAGRPGGEGNPKPRALTMPPLSLIALVAFCGATILLIPLGWYIPGFALWAVSAFCTARQPDPRIRRNLGTLLGCIAVLAFAPIHTGLDTPHMVTLFLFFAAVIAGPVLVLHRLAPGELRWRFWPVRFSKHDIIYTLISIPLAWIVIEGYFYHLNPGIAAHWSLPPVHDANAVQRLVLGINLVGIWDELFFINIVYGLLRGIFSARVANLAQAVVYTSVLYDMAFTGHGIWIVYLFALTQGVMYEKSRVLLYVLVVHLIVDLFLVLAILQWHYPGQSPGVFI